MIWLIHYPGVWKHIPKAAVLQIAEQGWRQQLEDAFILA